jgi:hypothetical protein
LKFIDNGGWEDVGLTLHLTFASCSVFCMQQEARNTEHRTSRESKVRDL